MVRGFGQAGFKAGTTEYDLQSMVEKQPKRGIMWFVHQTRHTTPAACVTYVIIH